MITFNHSGKLGDIIYSLYFCKSLSQKFGFSKFNFNIQINQPQTNPYENNNIKLSEENALYIKPLLQSQQYVDNVSINQKINQKQVFNLDNFRKLPLNTMAGHIPNYYYSLYNGYLKRQFDKPILNVEKSQKFKNKIILFYTERYKNIYVNLNVLQKFKNDIIFIGTQKQHKIFCKQNFNLEYYKVKNALELAQLLNGCKFVISNQNGNFSIAECLKTNRILIPAEIIKIFNNKMFGPCNVFAIGGSQKREKERDRETYDFAITTEKLITLTQEFYNL